MGLMRTESRRSEASSAHVVLLQLSWCKPWRSYTLLVFVSGTQRPSRDLMIGENIVRILQSWLRNPVKKMRWRPLRLQGGPSKCTQFQTYRPRCATWIGILGTPSVIPVGSFKHSSTGSLLGLGTP